MQDTVNAKALGGECSQQNEMVAEAQSGRGEKGGDVVSDGVRGRGQVPSDTAFYKGCVFFSRIRVEAIGGFNREGYDLPYC